VAEANEFVDAFERAWQDPIGLFADLFHRDGTLFQQGMDRPIAKNEITAHVTAIRALMPDQGVTVNRWAARQNDVFIEWTTSATFRGQEVSWDGASRFTLLDGLVLEEIAYFDTAPLRTALDPSSAPESTLAEAIASLPDDS